MNTYRVIFNNDGPLRYVDVKADGVQVWRIASGKISEIRFRNPEHEAFFSAPDVAAVVQL